ncbi:MAG: FG-GAP repeat domain-containing protein, partial [Acidimicrobiales bacterium]
PAGAAVPPILLAPAVSSPTGSPFGPGPGASTTVTVDLDGDGLLDVVVTDFATTTPIALLNQGGGHFGPPVPLPSSGGVLSIATGDFDEDGTADLVGHSEFGLVRWTGVGDGTFTLAQQLWAVGNAQPALAVGDLNSDGHADVVTPSLSGLQVYLGTGSGLVSGPATTAVGLLSDVAVANLNGDSHPDLVVVDATPFLQRVRAFLGTGGGRFTAAGSGAVGYGPEDAAVGDLDGDGIDDVVTSDSFSIVGATTFSLSVLRSNGNGGFAPRVSHPVGLGPVSAAIGDLNGDGHPDVAMSSVGDATVTLYANSGTGTLLPAGTVSVVGFPQTPAIADLDGDSAPDLAVPGAGSLSVLLNLG